MKDKIYIPFSCVECRKFDFIVFEVKEFKKFRHKEDFLVVQRNTLCRECSKKYQGRKIK
ncbi:MAG: hypothetical protein AABY22_28690 [Nanoarchaeota archaeon]